MHRASALLILALFLPSTLPASSQGQSRLDALAARGHIQQDAPVHASSQIAVNAPPAKVWRILTDVNGWPSWQSTVSAAHLDGPLVPGTSFTWNNGGTRITSRVARVIAGQEISWTGAAYGAHAIHLWHLRPQPDGSTLVTTEESMEGFLLSLFYSSEKLAGSHKAWLQDLKREAEK